MRKGGGEAVDVGDQALMRGLDTALPRVRPRRSLSYFGRRHDAGHNPSDGSSSAVASPPPLRKSERTISARLHLPPDCPDKACEFACDGDDDLVLVELATYGSDAADLDPSTD